LPLTWLWGEPDAQSRIQSAPAPYDLLREADAALPPTATVLLVTPGRDIGRQEYITYHRALYFLASRPVWWMAPTPSDGSWKSRWWISAPITPDSVRAIAAEKGAQYVLAYGAEDVAGLGDTVVVEDGGYLIRLGGDTPATEHTRVSTHISPIWPLQLAAGTAVMWVFGSMIVALASRLGYRASGIEAVGLAWALGAGVVSVLMLWLSALSIRLDGQILILTVAAAGWGAWRVTSRFRSGLFGPLNVQNRNKGAVGATHRVALSEVARKHDTPTPPGRPGGSPLPHPYSAHLHRHPARLLQSRADEGTPPHHLCHSERSEESRPSRIRWGNAEVRGQRQEDARGARFFASLRMTRGSGFAYVGRIAAFAAALGQPAVRAPGDEDVGPKRRLTWSMAANCLLLSLIAIQAAVVVVMAVGRPLEVWDSWVNWSMKARIIFLDGYVSPAVYADPSRAVTHLDYPLMVPLAEAWFFGWLGTPDDRLVGVASVLFYLSLVTVCYAAVRVRGGGQTGALLAATVVATMSLLAGLAGIVFAEMPLALFTAIAGLYLLKWLEGGSAGALLVASLGAGLALWTKKEGVLLLAAFCVAALATNFARRRAWQGAGALVLGAALLAGPWWAFTALNGIVNRSFLPITPDTFQANTGRLPTIAQLELNSLLNGWWSYIWPLAALVAVLTLFAGKHSPAARDKLLLMTAMLYVPLAGLIYVFSDFVPYEQHVLSSIDRLLAPIAPLLVVWVAFQTNAPHVD
jgi:hypothetical protein